MVTRDTNWPEGTPCWVDLAAEDYDKAVAFYSELFGWTVQQGPADFGGYAVATKDGRAVAGLMPRVDPRQSSMWTVYFATDDIEVTTKKVVEAGGQVVAEPMDVGDMGRMAVFADLDGAVVGLWQGTSHTGFQLANEPGSVTWNEIYARDYARSREFYAGVFGYTYDDIPMDGLDYATVSVGGQMVGGIGALAGPMAGVAPHVSVCFKAADTDATVTTVRRLGGRVIDEPEDSEYGRLAQVADDQGHTFWIMADVAG